MLKILLNIILFIFLFAVSLHGQEFGGDFEDVQEEFVEGEYTKALKGLEKITRDATKSYGVDNPYNALVKLYEAKCFIALGYLEKGLAHLDEAVLFNAKVNGENSSAYAYALKDAVDVYLLYGHYRKAEDYLDKAKDIFKAQGLITEDIDAQFQVYEANILLGKGFYSDAIKKIDEKRQFFESRMSLGSKDEIEKNKQAYAQLLIYRANAMRKMGDYLRADSAFVSNERWIEDQLGRKDLTYSLNKYYNGLLLEESGLDIDPLIDFYEDAYTQILRDYSPAHYLTMDIRDKLMRSYYRNSQKARLKIALEDMKKTMRVYHEDNSIYSLVEETFEFDQNLEDQRIKDIQNDLAALLGKNSIIPKDHDMRIDLLELAYRAALLAKDLANAENYLKSILAIKLELLGENAPEYHLTNIRLANFYIDHTDNFDIAKQIYDNSWDQVVEPQIVAGHPEYIDILNHMATFYIENDEYQKAGGILDDALYQARLKWDNLDIAYARELLKIADLEISIGNYTKSKDYLEEALVILEDDKTQAGAALLADAYLIEANLLAVYGEYDYAEANIFDAEKVRDKNDIVAVADADAQDKLAAIYLALGRYSEAKAILDASLKSKEERFGSSSRQLITPLITYAQLDIIYGEYAKAENRARKAYNLGKSIFGEKSTKIVPSLKTLADIYKEIGDFSRAEQILESALAIQKNRLGANHVDVAKTTSALALIKFYLGQDEDIVESLFQTAEQIIGGTLGSQNPVYADVLKNLAISNIAGGQYREAESYLEQAALIWQDKIGRRNNINASLVEVLYGDIRYNQYKYREAENFYSSALKGYEKFFSEFHPDYVKVLSKLSKAYYMQGDVKKAQRSLEEVLSKYETYIDEYFPALSEREKAKFWNTIRADYEFYNSIIVSHNRTDDALVGSMLNNALLTKSLLLNSSIKVRQKILNSGDQSLINLYNDWVSYKEQLTDALSMSEEELQAMGIDRGVLTDKVNDLEKELSKKSSDFTEAYDVEVVTWDLVQNALQPGEVAVEMVRFRYFNHTLTDSVLYAALYVEPAKGTSPGMVLLSEGSDLESRFLKYYRNSIRYKVDDPYSYDAYWRPIQNEIGNYATIYLSPDGVYNQINLEAIPDGNGNYILDRFNIVLISNIKDIYKNKLKERKVQESKIAKMFGNPIFYVDTKPGRPVAEAGLTRATSEVITQLPGTEAEINELQNLLSSNGWKADPFTAYEADEATIKAINNPRVFHVATHGFFKTDDGAEATNELAQNPLMRSGLLLKGAGDILNKTDYNFNINDGILTAYEAMNLNLDQTELVVLSACETGLGEVEAGEGVFGLQRSFLVAGAQTIIMSLFKVSDEATQELMIRFYDKWLKTGQMRRSFIEAKKEIREEYVDPIYWGPFVMIGMNQ